MNDQIREICNILLAGNNTDESMRNQILTLRRILGEEIKIIITGSSRNKDVNK